MTNNNWEDFKNKEIPNIDAELIILDNFSSKSEKKLLEYHKQFPNKILVFEDWWEYKTDIVKSILLVKADSPRIKKYYARKLKVKPVSGNDAKVFLKENHLQGYCPASLQYGLYDNDELIQIMTFMKARFTKDVKYELLRLATKKFCTVVGGTKRLWSHFLIDHENEENFSVVSYDDDSIFNGNVYKGLGFELRSRGDPGYCYYGYNKEFPLLRIHRSVFQKHKLAELFNIPKSEVDTEYETCIRHGLKKIIDCGQTVWVYKTKKEPAI